jgi:hypothetical protein
MGMPQDLTADQAEDCVVSTFEASNACTSAYFDPSGTRVLTTSYDDKLRGSIPSRTRQARMHIDPLEEQQYSTSFQIQSRCASSTFSPLQTHTTTTKPVAMSQSSKRNGPLPPLLTSQWGICIALWM